MRSRRPATTRLLLCSLMLLLTHASKAQTVADRTLRTSFEKPAASPKVTFRRRTPRVGDQADQLLTVEIKVKNNIRKGQDVVGTTQTSMTQRVQRVITTDDVRDDQTVGAQVRYVVSERAVKADDETGTVQQDPIAGKAYHCRREAEKLVITDEAGHLPTLAEYMIVADTMDSLGKPNPLADFLAGLTVGIGETITLPDDVAHQFALRMGDGIDNVERFDLTLTNIKQVSGRQCAVFQTLLEASETGSRQMKMQLDGAMVIELDTCRLCQAELEGPIGMAETAMGMGEAYQITGTGRMNVTIASSYDDAR